MSEYRAIYKCCLCGEKFENGYTTNKYTALQNMVSFINGCGEKQNIYIPISERFLHNCKDGSMGMADFLGFRKVEE